MNRSTFTRSLTLAAGLAAFPQGLATDQIVQVGRNTWPGDITVGIVCNYAKSGEQVRAMLDGFAPATQVKVVDARHQDHLDKACAILGRTKPAYVLVLPNDPLVRDGSWEASRVIQLMNFRQIPTLATTRAALAQGAWAVVGPDTGNVLHVNPALDKYREIIGPVTIGRAVAQIRGGSRATLSVVPAF